VGVAGRVDPEIGVGTRVVAMRVDASSVTDGGRGNSEMEDAGGGTTAAVRGDDSGINDEMAPRRSRFATIDASSGALNPVNVAKSFSDVGPLMRDNTNPSRAPIRSFVTSHPATNR
jgi:hypothetical protein